LIERPQWAKRRGIRQWENCSESIRKTLQIVSWEETLSRFFNEPEKIGLANPVLVTRLVPLKVPSHSFFIRFFLSFPLPLFLFLSLPLFSLFYRRGVESGNGNLEMVLNRTLLRLLGGYHTKLEIVLLFNGKKGFFLALLLMSKLEKACFWFIMMTAISFGRVMTLY